MRIHVTQNDIARGTRHSVGACPIALSLHRRGVDGYVFPTYVRVSRGPSARRFPLPQKAIEFVKSFDRKEPVHPVIFDLPMDEDAETTK